MNPQVFVVWGVSPASDDFEIHGVYSKREDAAEFELQLQAQHGTLGTTIEETPMSQVKALLLESAVAAAETLLARVRDGR